MSLQKRIERLHVSLVHDIIMVPLAWLGAFWIRFNFSPVPSEEFNAAVAALPVVIVLQTLAYIYFSVHRGVWRYSSVHDLLSIIKAVAAGSAVAVIVLFATTRLEDIPRSVPILYAILLTGFLVGPRLFFRLIKERRFHVRSGSRVLIVGAGGAGEMLVRDLLRDSSHSYEPVGFIDDDPRKQNAEIHRVKVLGGVNDIPQFVEELSVDVILLAIPTAGSSQMRRIVEACENTNVPVRTLPAMSDIVSGQVRLNMLRDVSVEDILGREQVELDWKKIGDSISGRTILVTGGGGSIGSELCRQIAKLGPGKLIILEQGEFNLFNIDRELREAFPNINIKSILSDVKDLPYIERIFSDEKPHLVFHAAAYKHVPLLEYQVRTATLNNVIGTRNVAILADKYECDGFVMISTDKAVNPGNIMGTTKRVAEIFCQTLSKNSGTRFITVRFGNVLGSAGSVIPIFREQIANGGPVTVTHPDITRFFMTIPEASQLILQSEAMGKGGEIFVLDMGEPVKISYMAEQMIILSGRRPGEDIDVVFTGLRPGEKLYEELFHNQEDTVSTEHKKINKAVSRSVDREIVENAFNRLQELCKQNSEEQIVSVLNELVPERLEKTDDGKGSNIVRLDSHKEK